MSNRSSLLRAQRRHTRTSDLVAELVLYLVLLAFFLPALWIILTSMRPNIEINSRPPVWIPQKFDFNSYLMLFGMPTPEGSFGMGSNVPFVPYARNSLVISLTSTAIALIFGTMAGYVFSRFRFKGKNAIFLSMMMARAVPGIALSLPLFLLFARLDLSDTVGGMIIVYVAMNVPFTAWLMDGFFRAIPRDLSEAATVDGCSHWQAFIRIDLPLALPGMAASGIFAFLTAWNEFALASVITRTPNSRTFPPGLFEFTGQYVSDWRGMCAMAVIMLIPAAVFVALIQRQLMQGLTAGAVRG